MYKLLYVFETQNNEWETIIDSFCIINAITDVTERSSLE